MRQPSEIHMLLKAGFRHLLGLCGGPKLAAEIVNHPDSHLSAAGAKHVTDRWPRLDHVIDFERYCGEPVVTRILADAQGFDLVPRGEAPPAIPVPLHLAHLIKEMGDVQLKVAEALADGTITAQERAAIIAEAQQAIDELHSLIADLKAKAS
jgi:hypothetical protein